MQTYKTDKLRYALLVFGSQPSSPIRFGLSLLDDETVGQFVEFVCLFFSFIGLPYRYLRLSKRIKMLSSANKMMIIQDKK